MNNQQKQVQIKAKEDDLKGVYSNVIQIAHNKEEFVLDFFNIVGQMGTLNSRIILSPGHLKRMLKALEGNLKKYEEKFGEIDAADTPKGGDFGFKTN